LTRTRADSIFGLKELRPSIKPDIFQLHPLPLQEQPNPSKPKTEKSQVKRKKKNKTSKKKKEVSPERDNSLG